MKMKLLTLFTLFFMMLCSTESLYSKDTPQETINRYMEKLKVISGESVSQLTRENELKTIIEDVFDFKTLSMLSLKQFWKNLKENERSEFIKYFSSLIKKAYLSKSDKLRGTHEVKFASEEVRNNEAKIKYTIKQKEVDIEIVYNMHLIDDRWRVYDVIIDASSLINNYNQQFTSYIKKHSFAMLLDTLKRKSQG